MLETMSHSPESHVLVGFGTHLEQVLAKQLNSFHAQSDVALHCCCLALVVAVGWSAAGGGFCGSAVHLPEVHMSVGEGDVISNLRSISVPQEVAFELLSHLQGNEILSASIVLLAL